MKTIKNIIIEKGKGNIDYDELKLLAIYHINSINNGNFIMEATNSIPTEEHRRIAKEAVISWIKYFFSIN